MAGVVQEGKTETQTLSECPEPQNKEPTLKKL